MRSVPLVSLILLLQAALGCAAQPQVKGVKPTPKGVAPVELKLFLPKSTYLVSEDLELAVAVTNNSSAPVEIPDPFYRDNWQPTYTVTGPEFPKGFTFSFRSAVLKDPRPEPASVPLKMRLLTPGQTVEKGVPLSKWRPITMPGDYVISARLAWQGGVVESNAITFRIGAPHAESLALGVDDRNANSAGDWVEWFHREGNSQELYTALYQRPHVDVRGYDAFSIAPLIRVAAEAADLMVPWTNYNRQAELTKWRVWREGESLVALATGLEKTSHLNLQGVPRALLRPALQTSDGLLDVFAISADGGSLMLARFPEPNFDDGPQPEGSIKWRAPLPPQVVAGSCALAPEQVGSARHVVLVAQAGRDLHLLYMNAGHGERAAAWQTIVIPNAQALPDSRPGIQVSETGLVDLALVFESGGAAHHVSVADIRLSPDGSRVREPAITDIQRTIGALPAPPRHAAVSYPVTTDGAMRRDWAILLENGAVVHSGNPGSPQILDGTPALPMQIISLTSSAYLLETGRDGKPAFFSLH